MKVRKLINNNDGTYTVPLTQGKVAIIDAEDAPYVGEYNWHAQYNHSIDGYYAGRTLHLGNKKYTKISMHRLITKCLQGMDIDHINHNTLDNRRSNLRIVSRSQNCMNRKVLKRTKSSIYKGIYWQKNAKKWHAQIRLNGKNFYIGLFDSEELAAVAYDVYAREFFGKYALLNSEK